MKCNTLECVVDEIRTANQSLFIIINGSGSPRRSGLKIPKLFDGNLSDKRLPRHIGRPT